MPDHKAVVLVMPEFPEREWETHCQDPVMTLPLPFLLHQGVSGDAYPEQCVHRK